MKKVTLFLHKNTHQDIPCKKSYFFLSIYLSCSSTTSVFVSLYLPKVSYLGVLFTYEIPHENILLFMDYDVVFRLEKNEN